MAGFNDWLEVTDPTLMAETIAERFRLSQAELMKAQEALAPAFALGIQRAMSTPNAWGDLAGAFAAMAPGASTSAAAKPGQAFLDAFFGSDALAGAVARQASLFAGIAPDTIQKLMPSLAMLTMETMVRTTMANLQRNQPAGLATGDFGGATAEMMRRGANAVEALSRPSDSQNARMAPTPSPFAPNPFTDAFSEALRTSFSWMQGTPGTVRETVKEPPAAPVAGAGFNPMQPFAAMFDAFARGMQGGKDMAGTGEAEASEPVAGTPATAPGAVSGRQVRHVAEDDAAAEAEPPAEDIVGDLMRSGQKFQEDYAREMASLFERYQKAAS